MADYNDCQTKIGPIRDVLDMIGSKWKLDILIAVGCNIHRFNELERRIDGITPRMLSKELKDLELNRLVRREKVSPDSNIVRYSLTEHGKSLQTVLSVMWHWGTDYRMKIMGKLIEPKEIEVNSQLAENKNFK